MGEDHASAAGRRSRLKPRKKSAAQPPRPKAHDDGFVARDLAVSALYSVLVSKRAFDDAFAKAAETRPVEARDRAFARLIATTALRRHAEIDAVLANFLEKPLPESQGRLKAVLLAAGAQLLFLDTPPHAAISIAVDQCRSGGGARRFDKLVNAVLRRVSEQGVALKAKLSPEINIPDWMFQRWQSAYGDAVARDIARASLSEPALDLTVKSDAEAWAQRLGGIVLPTGSVRLPNRGRIEALEGFDEGAWWVQDAGSALPAKLVRAQPGLRIADLCAAPGGKTAQLAALGAEVTAIDKSVGRLKRLSENLKRLSLTANTEVADASTCRSATPFDAVLIDAPCTATGTIRRHPDILHLKRPEDVDALAALQTAILDNAAHLVAPGGTLVYCTCSLEPEECGEQIAQFLAAHPGFVRSPITPEEVGGSDVWLTPRGELRTLPHHLDGLPAGARGVDGFYAARLMRKA